MKNSSSVADFVFHWLLFSVAWVDKGHLVSACRWLISAFLINQQFSHWMPTIILIACIGAIIPFRAVKHFAAWDFWIHQNEKHAVGESMLQNFRETGTVTNCHWWQDMQQRWIELVQYSQNIKKYCSQDWCRWTHHNSTQFNADFWSDQVLTTDQAAFTF